MDVDKLREYLHSIKDMIKKKKNFVTTIYL